MDAEVRDLVGLAEQAVAAGQRQDASSLYVEAGRAAAAGELWRIAIRCYRAALELDLLDRHVIARLLRLGARAGAEWDPYARTLDRLDWPHFACRGANIVLGDGPACVRCPEVGPVLELAMTESDLVDVRPLRPFAEMPLAMALVIARRALWPEPRPPWLDQRHRPAAQIRVVFDARRAVWLDELGDWRSRAL
ncbi:MAG: hypothetical protein ACM31C_09115 [Acidobacteriota bacterium]